MLFLFKHLHRTHPTELCRPIKTDKKSKPCQCAVVRIYTSTAYLRCKTTVSESTAAHWVSLLGQLCRRHLEKHSVFKAQNGADVFGSLKSGGPQRHKQHPAKQCSLKHE